MTPRKHCISYYMLLYPLFTLMQGRLEVLPAEENWLLLPTRLGQVIGLPRSLYTYHKVLFPKSMLFNGELSLGCIYENVVVTWVCFSAKNVELVIIYGRHPDLEAPDRGTIYNGSYYTNCPQSLTSEITGTFSSCQFINFITIVNKKVCPSNISSSILATYLLFILFLKHSQSASYIRVRKRLVAIVIGALTAASYQPQHFLHVQNHRRH